MCVKITTFTIVNIISNKDKTIVPCNVYNAKEVQLFHKMCLYIFLHQEHVFLWDTLYNTYPLAIPISNAPFLMLPARLANACSPEEHCLFTVFTGTVSGIPLYGGG